MLQKRLGTVVARPDVHAVAGQDLADIMGMDALHGEGDDAVVLLRLIRADDVDVGHVRHARQRPLRQGQLLPVHGLEAHGLHIVDGGVEPRRAGGVDGAGLKLVGQLREHRALPADGLDHFAAGEERGHLLQQGALSVQHADAHGAVDLVAGEGQEIRVQRLHVHGDVGRALGAVHHQHRAVLMGHVRQLADGVDAADDVGDVGHGHQLRPVGDEGLGLVQVQAAVRLAVQEFQGRAGLAAHHLPGQQVAVMLQNGDHHLVPGSDMAEAVAVRHQV